MPFSRVSFFFLAILLLSLALKIGTTQQQDEIEPGLVERAAVGMLTEKGYAVSVEKRSWSPLVRGEKDGCSLLILVRDPTGSTLNRIAQLAKPVGPVRYVYRGSIFAEPPFLDPLIRVRVVRQLRQLGIRTGFSPVLAVAASPQCDLKIFDWSRLASIA